MAMVITEVASSASLRLTMVAVAPAGRISSMPRPLEAPPLACTNNRIAVVSTTSWNSASHSAEGQRFCSGRIETRPKAK